MFVRKSRFVAARLQVASLRARLIARERELADSRAEVAALRTHVQAMANEHQRSVKMFLINQVGVPLLARGERSRRYVISRQANHAAGDLNIVAVTEHKEDGSIQCWIERTGGSDGEA